MEMTAEMNRTLRERMYETEDVPTEDQLLEEEETRKTKEARLEKIKALASSLTKKRDTAVTARAS